ncbi:MAG: replication protein A [Methanotrichaceae archaeon]|nr:replication protein A [Methanotrichaceae archaeon]
MRKLVDQISARLKEQKIEEPDSEIEAQLKKLIDDFRVPESEAKRSVLNHFLKKHGIPLARTKSQKVKIAEITDPGIWVDLEAKVIDLWEPQNETISQTGLVGDGTGAISFVKWSKAALPNVEIGKSYFLKNVVTDAFQGRFSIKLHSRSQIEPLDHEIKTQTETAVMQEMKIAEISEPGKWINLKAKVVQLWDSNSETISQAGLVGDETGSIRFVKWTKADLPELEEGMSYLFRNVITDEFQGRFSIKLNKNSQIEELKEEIEIGTQSVEFNGTFVDIQKGSGLIKRCPVCKRSLAKGICGEHGKVDGIYDLRIKAVLDDGRRVQDILVNRDATEKLVGISLEEAKQMAMEALDHEVVRSLIETKLMGRYFIVVGPRVDRYIMVETINDSLPVKVNEIDDLMSLIEVD